MNNNQKSCIGIDTSKDTLYCVDRESKDSIEVNNGDGGYKKLISWIKKRAEKVIIESTGSYHFQAALACHRAGITVCVVQPSKVRKFAESVGKLAKTDPIDAAMIAWYGSVAEVLPTEFPDDDMLELQSMQRRREQLNELLVAEKNRLHTAISDTQKESIKRMISSFKKEIRLIEKKIVSGIGARKELHEVCTIIDSVKGCGEVVSCAMVLALPELGKLSREEIAALVGVAPYNKDSGNKTGKRSIQGGRAGIRSMLYMATMSAIRFNPDIQAFYKRLRNKGKIKMVAFVACMRKLLILINALIRDRRSWEEKAPIKLLAQGA